MAIQSRVAAFLVCLATLSGPQTALADTNPLVDVLKNTPVSVFTYALQSVRQDLRAAFTGDLPYAKFTAPLTGQVADITTLIYSAKTDTIILNLVKIEKIPDTATPDEACRQAMAALRTFAGLDPATGALAEGMDTSTVSLGFYPEGTPIPDAASNPADIDKLFRLRFNGFTSKGRFTCTAELFATDHKLEIK